MSGAEHVLLAPVEDLAPPLEHRTTPPLVPPYIGSKVWLYGIGRFTGVALRCCVVGFVGHNHRCSRA